jgi:hypothetical protein
VKLVRCNGKELEVRDVGPVVVGSQRLPRRSSCTGSQILEDDAACELLRQLQEAGAASHLLSHVQRGASR